MCVCVCVCVCTVSSNLSHFESVDSRPKFINVLPGLKSLEEIQHPHIFRKTGLANQMWEEAETDYVKKKRRKREMAYISEILHVLSILNQIFQM